jgi:hypothetical protein
LADLHEASLLFHGPLLKPPWPSVSVSWRTLCQSRYLGLLGSLGSSSLD